MQYAINYIGEDICRQDPYDIVRFSCDRANELSEAMPETSGLVAMVASVRLGDSLPLSQRHIGELRVGAGMMRYILAEAQSQLGWGEHHS